MHKIRVFWERKFLTWRTYRNLREVRKNWDIFQSSAAIIQDGRGVVAKALQENLTFEEMDGVSDAERFIRLLTMDTKALKKDLSQLRKSLAI